MGVRRAAALPRPERRTYAGNCGDPRSAVRVALGPVRNTGQRAARSITPTPGSPASPTASSKRRAAQQTIRCNRLLRDTTIAFEKKPAVSLEIFRPVSSPLGSVFNRRKYCCPCRFRALEMGIEVVYQDEDAIDNPRGR